MSKPERLNYIASLANARKHTVARLIDSTLTPAQCLRVMRRIRG